MRSYPVIFLNTTTDEQGCLIPAEQTLAVATLRYWLGREGITDTAVFPEISDIDANTVRRHFTEFIAGHKAVIYAISCWSSSYHTALLYTEIIRAQRPEAIIIGGGAHFHSRENISKALMHGGFDLIFQGAADPFFEFCKNFFIDHNLTLVKAPSISLNGKIPKEGLFYIMDGKLNFSRHGVLTRAVVPITQLTGDYAEMIALFSDECGNNCDYCSVFKNRTNEVIRAEAEELIRQAYNRLKAVWNGQVILSIMDSSPFLDKNRARSFASIKRLAAMDSRLHFSVLADPDDLDEEFIAFSKENRIKIFFIGRDRIVEDAFVGRRLRGRLRTPQQLEDERCALADFIRGMEGTYCDMFIGYIASPFDTAENAALLAEEIRYFTRIARMVKVVPNIFVLNPYAGTSVYRKSGGKAWDISEFRYPYPNVWNDREAEMIWLELLRLTVAPVFVAGGLQMGLYLLEFAAHLAFGNPLPSVAGLTDEMRLLADYFTENVNSMDLGKEPSLKEWQEHVNELRQWGLIMALAAGSPGMLTEYGIERLISYVMDNDTLAGLFHQDLELIASKDFEGTWYERWRKD